MSSSDESEEILKELKIPPAPDIILQLQQELRADNPSLEAIGEIIQKDAAISGLVLKTVNSPLFGLRATIQSYPRRSCCWASAMSAISFRGWC